MMDTGIYFRSITNWWKTLESIDKIADEKELLVHQDLKCEIKKDKDNLRNIRKQEDTYSAMDSS